MNRYSMYIDNHGNWVGKQTLVVYSPKDEPGEYVKVSELLEWLRDRYKMAEPDPYSSEAGYSKSLGRQDILDEIICELGEKI